MRVVVTGGRHYNDRETVFRALSELASLPGGVTALAHGACPTGSEELAHGADWLADAWGQWNGLVVGETLLRYPATKAPSGRFLGPERNRRMLEDFRPDLVVAFPGGRGTAHCVGEATRRGIRVRIEQ